MTTYTKQATHGAATVLFFTVLAAFFGYLVKAILARYLSVEQFGLFYSVFAFLGLIGLFKTLGLDKALIKFIPEFLHKKQYNNIKSAMAYAALVQLLMNTLIIILMFALADFLSAAYFKNEEAVIVLKLMSVAFMLDSFVWTIKYSLQGFKRMFLFSFMDIGVMISVLGIIFLAANKDLGILTPVLAYTITPIIIILIFGYILTRKVFPEFKKAKISITKELRKRLSKYGIYIMATTVGTAILGNTDIILLTYFVGLEAVAMYSVALPTAKLFLYLPRAFGGILLPLTSELWAKKNLKILKEGIHSLFKYATIVIIPAVLALASFAGTILGILFGEQYKAAATALQILAIGMIFGTLYGVAINFFPGIGRPEINSKIVYSAAGFNIIGNIILIPMIGIIGAAITTSISYFIMMCMGLYWMKKIVKIDLPFLLWSKITISGILFVVVVGFLKNLIALNIWVEMILVLSVAGFIYLAALFALKIITIQELQDLYKRVMP